MEKSSQRMSPSNGTPKSSPEVSTPRKSKLCSPNRKTVSPHFESHDFLGTSGVCRGGSKSGRRIPEVTKPTKS